MKRGITVIVTMLAILATTAFVDSAARAAHQAQVRAEVSAHADALARSLSDVIARESAAVETLSAFVEITAGDPDRLASDFPVFAAALIDVAPKIRSVQLGPDSILEYVFPLDGNEQAVGLDLMADPDRRVLLERAKVTGDTVIQGPVGLVQGGTGLIVRRAVYERDGTFWGFAAIVLDWPGIAAESGLEPAAPAVVAGLMREAESDTIAGSLEAFDRDPVIRNIQVGATATTWTLAMRPSGGWPTTAPDTSTLWVSGVVIALLAAIGISELLGRPEALRAERERALRDLAIAEAQYRATFQHAGVGIVVATFEGEVISANRAFKDIVGLGVDVDVTGRPVSNFVHPDDFGAFDGLAEKLFSSLSVVELELRLSRDNGDRLCRVQMTTLRHDTTSYFVAVIEDITERRQSEAAVAESEARYRHLFQAAPIAIQRQDFSVVKEHLDAFRAAGVTDLKARLDEGNTLADLVGLIRVTDANPMAIQLNRQLGSTGDGEDLEGLMSEEARLSFTSNLVAIWDGSDFVSVPVSPTTTDGRQLHLDLRWQPVPTPHGLDYSQVMVTINDVTHLTETQRRLEDLLTSKDRFLASIAHELRTPLTAVVGFAQELNDNPDLDPGESKEFIGLVAQNSLEMSHLIEDILVIARAEIGQVTVVAEAIDLADEVRSVLASLPDHQLTLDESASASAYADPSRVRQICRNLVTNAVRYGGPGVVINVGSADGTAFVDICDDGPQLSAAEMSRIFEPYERLQGSSSTPDSIGLGLTVSRALARAQGGDVTTRRQDDSNVFRLSLPVGADT